MAEALDSSVRLGLQYDQAVILYYSGVLAQDDADKASLLIQKARTMLEALGCNPPAPS